VQQEEEAGFWHSFTLLRSLRSLELKLRIPRSTSCASLLPLASLPLLERLRIYHVDFFEADSGQPPPPLQLEWALFAAMAASNSWRCLQLATHPLQEQPLLSWPPDTCTLQQLMTQHAQREGQMQAPDPAAASRSFLCRFLQLRLDWYGRKRIRQYTIAAVGRSGEEMNEGQADPDCQQYAWREAETGADHRPGSHGWAPEL
jgi:hypothetical protein